MYSGPSDVKQVVKARRLDSSKRDFGCLLIVGGSEVYSGAPALAGLAALRTGAGLVLIAAPASVAATIRGYSPNLIVYSLSGSVVSARDMEKLSELLESSDALVLGPGIGRNRETTDVVPSIVEMAAQAKKPILVDADAIRAFAERKQQLKAANVVITPHAGEFRAISGIDARLKGKQRLPICKKFAKDYSCILLLKGHNTVVSDGRRLRVNRTGNPGMAVGGMGDVLSGIIGTFLAQGADRFFAAVAGAYIHGLAGDLVRKQKGFHMVASDLIEALPYVLRRYDTTRTDGAKSYTSQTNRT
jgi:NAD(P)H-hydrate epimerase